MSRLSCRRLMDLAVAHALMASDLSANAKCYTDPDRQAQQHCLAAEAFDEALTKLYEAASEAAAIVAARKAHPDTVFLYVSDDCDYSDEPSRLLTYGWIGRFG